VTVRTRITTQLDFLDYLFISLLLVIRCRFTSYFVLIYFTLMYTIQCSFSSTADRPPPFETAIVKDLRAEKVIEVRLFS